MTTDQSTAPTVFEMINHYDQEKATNARVMFSGKNSGLLLEITSYADGTIRQATHTLPPRVVEFLAGALNEALRTPTAPPMTEPAEVLAELAARLEQQKREQDARAARFYEKEHELNTRARELDIRKRELEQLAEQVRHDVEALREIRKHTPKAELKPKPGEVWRNIPTDVLFLVSIDGLGYALDSSNGRAGTRTAYRLTEQPHLWEYVAASVKDAVAAGLFK